MTPPQPALSIQEAADAPDDAAASDRAVPYPKVLGMLIQVEGERAYLERHLVFANALVRTVGARTQYQSNDGHWCVWPGSGGNTVSCPSCRALLREAGASRPRPSVSMFRCQEKPDTMPHKNSLTAHLIEIRRRYTGEPPSAAVPEVRNAVTTLGAEDRRHLRDVLDSADRTALLPRLRGALIPNAASVAQQRLETAVLQAASRVAFTHPKVIRAVVPRPDALTVHVYPEVVGPLLRELMPREHDDGLRGVPGLRVRSHYRHLSLYLLDDPSGPRTAITIPSVPHRRFFDILDTIDADRSTSDPLRWVDNQPQPLRPVERELLSAAPYAPLASAILRRIRMFTTIPEVTVSPGQEDSIALDWHQGPSTAAIVLHLLHPLAGLPTMSVVAESLPTHLVLGTDHTRLWLRGPDMRPICPPAAPATIGVASAAGAAVATASEQRPFTTGELRARVVDRITGNHVHAYGTEPADTFPAGQEHATTVLTTRGDRPRWFRISVQEIAPDQMSVLSADHDAVVTLARRAGVDRPWFRLSPR
jgi:hypothetical protein